MHFTDNDLKFYLNGNIKEKEEEVVFEQIIPKFSLFIESKLREMYRTGKFNPIKQKTSYGESWDFILYILSESEMKTVKNQAELKGRLQVINGPK
jgi:hypothetical protein